MTTQHDRRILDAYVIYVETPDDPVFRADGVVFFDQHWAPDLYCHDSRYNFLRAVLNRFSLEELRGGVNYRKHQIELRPLSIPTSEESATMFTRIPDILRTLVSRQPAQFWFLKS
jgi:hypothetical protein